MHPILKRLFPSAEERAVAVVFLFAFMAVLFASVTACAYQFRWNEDFFIEFMGTYARDYSYQLKERVFDFNLTMRQGVASIASNPKQESAIMAKILDARPIWRGIVLLDAQGHPIREFGRFAFRYPSENPALTPWVRTAWRGCPSQRNDCVAPPVPDPLHSGLYLVGNLVRIAPSINGAAWLVAIHPQIYRDILAPMRRPFPHAAIVALRLDDHLLQMRDPEPQLRGFGFPQAGALVKAIAAHPNAISGRFYGITTATGEKLVGSYVLMQDPPFAIGVDIPYADLVAAWFRSVSILLIVTAIVAAVQGSLYVYTIRSIRRAKDMQTRARRALRQQLVLNARLARRDVLTNLLNRRGLFKFMARAQEACLRDGVPYAIIMMDIDHFKRLNDEFGHETGDNVLREIGRLLGEHIRPQDAAARWGGEEFLIYLSQTDLERAADIAERIRTALAAATLRSERGEPLHVTASMGLAANVGTAGSIDDLISHADKLLYKAKTDGRNRIETEPRFPGDVSRSCALFGASDAHRWNHA